MCFPDIGYHIEAQDAMPVEIYNLNIGLKQGFGRFSGSLTTVGLGSRRGGAGGMT